MKIKKIFFSDRCWIDASDFHLFPSIKINVLHSILWDNCKIVKVWLTWFKSKSTWRMGLQTFNWYLQFVHRFVINTIDSFRCLPLSFISYLNVIIYNSAVYICMKIYSKNYLKLDFITKRVLNCVAYTKSLNCQLIFI